MEQVVLESSRTSRPEKNSVADLKGNLTSSQTNLITEDLATFLVTHHVLISGNDSIASIKEYFSSASEICGLVDGLLAQMEEAGLISVSGDKIKVQQRFLDIGGNVENLKKFLPRLFRLSAERILADAENGTAKAKKENLRYFALPNDQETCAEAQAIYVEFKSKMLNLMTRAEKESRSGTNIRLIGVLNCSLTAEDFV